jgi:hypothetical protein
MDIKGIKRFLTLVDLDLPETKEETLELLAHVKNAHTTWAEAKHSLEYKACRTISQDRCICEYSHLLRKAYRAMQALEVHAEKLGHHFID